MHLSAIQTSRPTVSSPTVSPIYSLAILMASMLFAALGLATAAAGADPAFLAADLEEGRTGPSGGVLGESVELGKTLFFAGYHPRWGWELWKSDGTAASTKLVKDGSPGIASSLMEVFEVALGRVFYTDRDAAGIELWVSDGTAAGTIQLISGHDGVTPLLGRPADVLGDRLYFGTVDDLGRFDVWSTDGTRSGSRREGRIVPGHNQGVVAVLDGALLVATWEPGRFYTQLWRTDADLGNTTKLRDEGFGGPLANLTLADQVFFVNVVSNASWELWQTNGSPERTRRVTSLCPGSCGLLGVFDGFLYFLSDSPRGGVYRTGRRGERIEWVAPGWGTFPRQFVSRDDRAFFVTALESKTSVWEVEKRATGGRPVRALEVASFAGQAWVRELTAAGGRAFVLEGHANRLWAVAPQELLVPAVDRLAAFGDRLLFSRGSSLWTTDGTVDGIRRFKRIGAGARSSAPQALLATGSGVLVATAFGQGLYRSDATAAGTFPLLADAAPIDEIFRLDEGWLVSNGTFGRGLWQLDPAATTTTLISSEVGGTHAYVRLGKDILMAGWGPGGMELWATDLSPEGTRMVKNIAPFDFDFELSSNPADLVRLGDRIFFSAWDNDGRELWSSDGTEEGTQLLLDICEGCSADPRELMVIGSRLFFTAIHPETGRELWVSDGTADGTVLLADLVPGHRSSDPRHLTVSPFGNEVLFFAAGAVWKSAGEDVDLLDDLSDDGPAHVEAACRVDGHVFFVLDPETRPGRELWSSDGTAGGVRRVKGGFSEIDPDSLAAVAGKLLFGADAANRRGDGVEPWVSDGTAAGTRMIQNIQPGSTSSRPRDFTLDGDLVYFSAGTVDHGVELWAMPASAIVEAPDP